MRGGGNERNARPAGETKSGIPQTKRAAKGKKKSRGAPLRGRCTPAYPARLRSERARNLFVIRRPGTWRARLGTGDVR